MTIGLMHLIRIPIFVTLFFVLYRGIKKTKLAQRRIFLPGLILVTLAVMFVSEAFPPENLFLTFSAPEQVATYQKGSPAGKPFQIVEGQHSALLCYGEKSDSSVEIIPKSGEGWKLPVGLMSVSFDSGIIETEGLLVSTTAICGKDDVYLQIIPMDYEKDVHLALSHNRDTEFSITEDRSTFQGRQIVVRTYVACVGTLEDYRLMVNGHSFVSAQEEALIGGVLTWAETKDDGLHLAG